MRFDDDEVEIITLALRCLQMATEAQGHRIHVLCATYCVDKAVEILRRIAQHRSDEIAEKNDVG